MFFFRRYPDAPAQMAIYVSGQGKLEKQRKLGSEVRQCVLGHRKVEPRREKIAKRVFHNDMNLKNCKFEAANLWKMLNA